MSKFFISNNSTFVRKAQEIVEKNGFQISFINSSDTVSALASKKLTMKLGNCNAYSRNDDYVVTNGTLIYKSGNGNDAWSQLYDDFYGDIGKIREDSTGNYAIGIKKENELFVFCEAFAIYNIYYYITDDRWFVSNSLYDMACVLSKYISVNELNVIEESWQNTILGDETIFNEIRRLGGDEYIYVDLRHNIPQIIHINCEYERIEDVEYENNLDGLADLLKIKAKKISSVFGAPCICMTGGLDSRVSLAAYLSIGILPYLMYGVGDTPLTNTKNADMEIVKKFSHRYNLNLNICSWKTSYPVNKHWAEYANKYGFGIYNYEASPDIMNSFENSSGQLLTFGFFGELFRNLPWIEERKQSFFSLNEFIDEYYITNDAKRMTAGIREYREHIEKKLLKLCKKFSLNPDRIENEENFLFLMEYRKGADSKILNLLNMIKYSNYLITEYDVIQNMRVSVAKMKKSRFQLELINKLYSDSLNIPVFSHLRRKYFDSKKLELRDHFKDIFLDKLKKSARLLLPENIQNDIRHILYDNSKNKDSLRRKEVLENLFSIINTNSYSFKYNIDFKNYIDYLPKLSRYAMTLYLLKQINQTGDFLNIIPPPPPPVRLIAMKRTLQRCLCVKKLRCHIYNAKKIGYEYIYSDTNKGLAVRENLEKVLVA
jgi:hypothetical protein